MYLVPAFLFYESLKIPFFPLCTLKEPQNLKTHLLEPRQKALPFHKLTEKAEKGVRQ